MTNMSALMEAVLKGLNIATITKTAQITRMNSIATVSILNKNL